MDVLNTYGGGTDAALILLGILACTLGFILLIAGVATIETPCVSLRITHDISRNARAL